jgi:uncharacterized protein
MQNAKRVPRGLQSILVRSWSSSPVVVLEGARTTGKTTLARNVVEPSRFVSFVENPDQLARAQADLRGFLESLPFGCVLDEAQLVPNLQMEIKGIVDRTGRPGQFLLTGSARLNRTELGGSPPLAGRDRRIRVHGFAQTELEGSTLDVVTALFDSDPRDWIVEPTSQASVVSRFASGGMPTFYAISDPLERARRTSAYVDDLFDGDVYETGRNRSGITRLFRYLAATSSAVENFAKYQNGTQLSKDAVVGYLDALRAVFLVDDVPAYSRVPGTRETDRPRSYVLDPAFVASQVRGNSVETLLDVERAGAFLETVVAQELQRLLGWSSTDAKLHHWRRNDKDEVDLVLERHDGMLIAIEVKSKRSISNRDAVGIAAFRAQYPDRFLRGFVVHPGDAVLPVVQDVWALPISALWTIGESVADAVENPLSFQQRLDRAVGTVIDDNRLIPAEEVMNRQRLLVAFQPLIIQRMDAIVSALWKLEVPARIETSQPWVPAWPRPQAEPSDELFAETMVLDVWAGADDFGSARVSVSLVDETVVWKLWSTGMLEGLANTVVSALWSAEQGPVLEQLFGLLADTLPEIVRAHRQRIKSAT